MISPALLLKSTLPRSKLVLVLSLGVLSLGVIADPVIGPWIEGHDHWFAQYCATVVLAGFGITLGLQLRRIRAWPAALAVPHLLRDKLLFDLGMIVVLWMVCAAVMVASGTLAGYATSLSLAGGVIGLAAGAGTHRGLAVACTLLAVGIAIVSPLRLAFLDFLQWSGSEPILLGTAAGVAYVLFRQLAKPMSDADMRADSNLEHVEYSSVKTRYATALPLSPMEPEQALLAVFEHSKAQAWINTLSWFLLSNSLFVFLLALDNRSGPNEFVVTISMMTSLMATILPFMSRDVMNASADLLCLTGIRKTRAALIRTSFYHAMRESIRLAFVGVVVAGLFLGAQKDWSVYSLALGFLLSSPGNAAILLAAAIVMHERGSYGHGATLIFGLVMLTELLCAGFALGWLNVRLPIPVFLTLVVLFSVVSVVVCARLTSWTQVWRRDRQ